MPTKKAWVMTEAVIRNGFVLGLHDDLRPLYRLNPFTTAQLERLRSPAPVPCLVDGIDAQLTQQFGGRPFVYTANGRQAIREALRRLKLRPQDCVTIFTSTGNSYISGCVISEITPFCQWSRQIEANTKVLFVNHEFGVPFPGLAKLKDFGLPIIEDCCYSFHSATHVNQMGQIGDYVLYSFAKYFPIQFGGALVGPVGEELPTDLLDAATQEYLRQAMVCLYPSAEAIARERQAHHMALAQRLTPLGLLPRFDFELTGGVPGVYMFTAPATWPLPALKEFLWACGIHCSVFYGEQAFFIPVHQGLDETALDYFTACLAHFSFQHALC